MKLLLIIFFIINMLTLPVFSEDLPKVFKLIKIESTNKNDQEKLKEGYFLILDPNNPLCSAERYANGIKERCFQVEGDTLIMASILGQVKVKFLETEKNLTFTTPDGVTVTYLLMKGLLKEEAIRLSGNSEKGKEKQLAEEFKKKIEGNKVSLKKLKLDTKKYVNKEITLYGYLKLRDYYNYTYKGSKSTHYSTDFSDKDFWITDSISIYWDRESFEGLIDKLDDTKVTMVKIKIILLPEKYEENPKYSSQAMFEGLEIEVLDK
jgi:hypothetical protein